MAIPVFTLSMLCVCHREASLENEITIIDIGQGDSILLRDWRGKTILIDTGGKVDFGQKEQHGEIGRSTSNAERTLAPLSQE